MPVAPFAKVTVSPVALTVALRLSCPKFVIGWLGTATAPPVLFFQQEMSVDPVNEN